MPLWIGPLVGAIVGIVTFFGTLIVQARIAARIEGALGADIRNHGEALKTLRTEQDQQWSKINEHGERISRVEAQVKK